MARSRRFEHVRQSLHRPPGLSHDAPVASDFTHYEVLGVDPSAPQVEIARAYRRAAHQAHPDTRGSSLLFRLVQEAYETLREPSLRAEYDTYLRNKQRTAGGGQKGAATGSTFRDPGARSNDLKEDSQTQADEEARRKARADAERDARRASEAAAEKEKVYFQPYEAAIGRLPGRLKAFAPSAVPGVSIGELRSWNVADRLAKSSAVLAVIALEFFAVTDSGGFGDYAALFLGLVILFPLVGLAYLFLKLYRRAANYLLAHSARVDRRIDALAFLANNGTTEK